MSRTESSFIVIPPGPTGAAALVEAEVGRLWAESSRAADDADAQLKLLTKELIDVEKLASNLVGRAEDDAKEHLEAYFDEPVRREFSGTPFLTECVAQVAGGARIRRSIVEN